MPLPPNVLSHWGEPFYPTLETTFLERLFAHLQSEVGETFKTLTFVLYKHKAGKPIPPFTSSGPNTVLLLLADESGDLDCTQLPPFNTIFRSYSRTEELRGNIAHFPVGYSNEVGLVEPIPFAERKYDLTFSGNFNSRRLDLFRQFTPFRLLPKQNIHSPTLRRIYKRFLKVLYPTMDFSARWANSYIRFTDGFMQGLEGPAYANLIANSRVVLCPSGFVSNECIRHWEAMRHGCVIVSAPLPEHPLYQGYPMRFVEDWSELISTIDGLLADKAELERLHLQALDHWKNKSGEAAVARYMARVILSNQT